MSAGPVRGRPARGRLARTDAWRHTGHFVALVVVAIAAVILVVPSFALLFTLQGRRMLGDGQQGTPPAAASQRHSAPPSTAHPGQPSPNRLRPH